MQSEYSPDWEATVWGLDEVYTYMTDIYTSLRQEVGAVGTARSFCMIKFRGVYTYRTDIYTSLRQEACICSTARSFCMIKFRGVSTSEREEGGGGSLDK